MVYLPEFFLTSFHEPIFLGILYKIRSLPFTTYYFCYARLYGLNIRGWLGVC